MRLPFAHLLIGYSCIKLSFCFQVRMSKLLIVDDDVELTKHLKESIANYGWSVEAVHTGLDASQMLESFGFDMVLLDWDLPDITGIDVCRAFRQRGKTTPVIFITGKDELNALENALDIGADDYITKPFELRELMARIRSLQRRASGLATSDLIIGDAKLDKKSRKLYFGSVEVKLTALENELVEYLMRHPNQIFSSADLFNAVWSSDTESTVDTVRVHIRILRRKLGLSGHADFVKTVLGSGYVIESKT